ncbi:MAG: response regulator transcription factor [Bacillota bacterium]|jgi:DNA-binding NarL/FixJ family response regulator|nr:response regulator transcription factor [Bacillota bacterium]HHU29773.1 response regulator transcription factor [Bacillota bacterium]
MTPIRVLLADDQTIVRAGLRALLELNTDIRVVGEAGNGSEAYELAKQLRPDVVLMDIRMPVLDGVEATRLIKQDCPGTVIIVLTTFDDDDYIIKAMTYGASGYLLKDIGSEKLISAIYDGLSGNIILPGRVAKKITSHLARQLDPQTDVPDFTARELDIIRLLVQGRSNRQIAAELYLSVGTVKNYLTQIYMKINVKDRGNAILYLKKIGF